MTNILLYIFTGLNLLLYLYIIIVSASKWKISKAHRRFFFFALFSFLWVLDVVFQAMRENPLSWARYIFVTHVNFALAALVAASIVSFILHFPRNNSRLTIIKETLLLLPLFILAVLSFTNLFVVVTGFRMVGVAPAYPIYLVILVIYFVLFAGFVFFKKIKTMTGVTRTQLKYIAYGYLIGIVILLGESVYINIINIVTVEIDLLITNITFLFAALAAYAMLRYRFMDVRVIIRKGVIYSISLLLTLAVYTYIALTLKEMIEKSWNINTTWTAVILIALVALGFPPLKNLVERAVNTLFKGRKSIDLAVKELQEKVAEKTDLDVVVGLISGEIKKYLDVGEVKFYIINHRDKRFIHKSEDGLEEMIERNNDLLRYFEKYREPLVRDEISHMIEERAGEFEKDMLRKAEKELKKKKASLALPFFTEDEVFGVVFLGERPQNKAYTVEDVKYLEQLREQTQFVVANAILYKEAVERVREMAAENA